MRKLDNALLKKMAKKNILRNHSRNIVLAITVFITTFIVATIISLCVNQIEQQHFWNLKQGEGNREIESIVYILLMSGVFVLVAGFLIINNVMSASLSRDTRLYGLLKAVGMSQKQITKMILKQIRSLCIVTIPLGFIVSIFTTKLFVPIFFRMYTQFSLEEKAIIFHPVVFIATAVFIYGTILVGAYKPVKMAAQLSPIEAVKFSEYGYFYKKSGTSKYSAIKMAWRNIIRIPQRAVKVFGSLFLGMTAFLAVSVILGSANIELFMEQAAFQEDNHIHLRNRTASIENYILNDAENVLTEQLISNLGEVDGFAKMDINYCYKIQMDTKDRDGNIQKSQGCIYGISSEEILELSKELDEPIDIKAFERGEFVIVRNINRGAYVDTQNVTFMVENKTLSYAIGGWMPAEWNDYFGKSYNWFPCVYISDEVLKSMVAAPIIYEIELSIEQDFQDQAFHSVKEMLNNNEKIIIYSNIETRMEAKTIVSTLTFIGNSITVMLWVMGFLNFVSVMITEIFARQHEFALLESVGESAKQIKRELMAEGGIYAIITLSLVSTLGSFIIYGLFHEMKKQFHYMDFQFPIVSVLIMICVIFLICLLVPNLIYHYMSKSSIVDRLRSTD